MWDISDFTDEMQSIWDCVIPNIPHTVSRLNDPVYKILMQRTYDYHSNFGECAQVVVQKFIKKEGWTPSEIHEVVAYVVPQQAKLIDKKGKPILVNPPVYPYMWKECVGDEADPNAYHGAFEDHCILDTFTLYLEYVHKLPTVYHCQAMPKGALSIATVAVCRTNVEDVVYRDLRETNQCIASTVC
ncbi:hypothetical protein BDR07DRAFT_1385041 [Suillus spraguei]|nr:hypothetical protein BDR07DRAFT_1385041 [Suillus spraguei]